MNFKEMLEKISVLSEETQETKKGRVHKAEPGGYGRKLDTDEEGEEKKTDKPEVKRGRGRPKKGADETGEVKKYEFGGVEKAMGGGKAPKKTPKPSTKHTLKDWFDMMDKKAIKENTAPGQQLSVKPLPGASQLVDPASNKVIATGPADKIKAMQGSVAKGEVTMRGDIEEMSEEEGDKKWIKGAIKHPGAFTKKAKSHGMSTSKFASKVLANKEDYPAKTEKQAQLAKTLGKLKEAERPSDQVDMGAGLGAGRSQKTLETKQKVVKNMKKHKVNESMHKHTAARLEGKAHALRKDGYNCRYDDMEEARAYHEGFKEGLDECYGLMPARGVVDETGAPATPPATTGGMAGAAMPAMEAMSSDGLLDSIQPVLNFAMSKGYKMQRGKGNSINFMYDLGMGFEPVMKATVYFDKDLKAPWVNFAGIDMSGNDPANTFMDAFRDNHEAVMDEVSAEKQSRDEEGEFMQEGMSTDGLFDAIQPVLNFAMSKGYTVKKGKGNSINFMYDLGMGDEPVMNAQVYFDKDLNKPWVNFEGMDMSGSDPADVFLGTFKQNHEAVMDEVSAEKEFRDEEDMEFNEMDRGEYMKNKAETTPGDTFNAFGQTFQDKEVLEADKLAFESLDKQLNQLLTEGSEVNEGMSVSISKGQQGSPDSVTVSAQDAEAEQLLSFIKQAGLGLFGDQGPASNYGAPDGESSVEHGGINVVGDHDGMMGLMKKISGIESEPRSDYEDEEGHEEEHGEEQSHGEEIPEVCAECGGMMEEGHQCGGRKSVGEVEDSNQREFVATEDNAPDSDEAETSADEEAEAGEDQALAKADQQDKTLTMNEWANDAGQTPEEFKEETFTTEMDFMLKTISGGLNKPKSTGQQTIPVLAGDKERTNVEEGNSWYKKYSDILKQAE